MRRMWPEELNHVFEGAEEVVLHIPHQPQEDGSVLPETHRAALKVRLPQETYEQLWPHIETRYRLGGNRTGQAVTLIANNPHYHAWHPADGGEETVLSGQAVRRPVKYVIVHFLLDDVSQTA